MLWFLFEANFVFVLWAMGEVFMCKLMANQGKEVGRGGHGWKWRG